MAKNRYTRRKLLKYDIGGEIGGSLDQFAETGSFTGFGTGKDYGIASGPTSSRNNNAFSTASNTVGVLGNLAGGLNQGNYNQYQSFLPGQSDTQRTVDTVVGAVLPFYSTVKQVGNLAKSSYMAQNEYGELNNTNEFLVAEAIAMFLDPLSSFISGLSGEGWTPKQKAELINEQGAEIRKRFEAEQQKGYLDYERTRNPGNFRETSGLGYAAYSGKLPMYQAGGFTDYQTGQKHGQSSMDGIPVDSIGNPSANSGRPATGLTEKNEVTYNGYVFSDQLYI